MNKFLIERDVLVVQHGEFTPDGETESIRYASVVVVDDQVVDEEGRYGSPPVKLRIVEEHVEEVFESFKNMGGRGRYNLELDVRGKSVAVKAIAATHIGQSKAAASAQGKRA